MEPTLRSLMTCGRHVALSSLYAGRCSVSRVVAASRRWHFWFLFPMCRARISVVTPTVLTDGLSNSLQLAAVSLV